MSHHLVRNRRTYSGEGVYIGRPSPDGNPFTIGKDGDRPTVIQKHIAWWNCQPEDYKAACRKRLRGRILICWCAPEDCHGDFLAEEANRSGG